LPLARLARQIDQHLLVLALRTSSGTAALEEWNGGGKLLLLFDVDIVQQSA